jgi:gas vesicle protein
LRNRNQILENDHPESSNSDKQLKTSIMSSGKVLLGVLAGVAAGALIGILFAPDKGSETRKKIVEKGEDYVDGMKDKFNGLIDDLGKKMDGMQAKANKMADDAKATVEEAKV